MTNCVIHFFIKEVICRKDPSENFQVNSQTDERFTSISFGRLSFIDSMQFMKMSIDAVLRAHNLDDFTFGEK